MRKPFTCVLCGGAMVGDGYLLPVHCENAERSFDDVEADSGPWFCAGVDIDGGMYSGLKAYGRQGRASSVLVHDEKPPCSISESELWGGV